MNQTERRIYLINNLLSERLEYVHMQIPTDSQEQKKLLHSLFNIRVPKPILQEFLNIQDEYLQEEISKIVIIRLEDLTPEKDNLYLWQGDITTLQCDAIVNAANSELGIGIFF